MHVYLIDVRYVFFFLTGHPCRWRYGVLPASSLALLATNGFEPCIQTYVQKVAMSATHGILFFTSVGYSFELRHFSI